MRRRHESLSGDSTDNGENSDATSPSRRADGGQSPQSPQQATSGDWCVGQVREEAFCPPPKVIEAITQAAMWGGLGIGNVPYTHFPDYHDTKSRVKSPQSVLLGDIPPAK